MRSVIRTAVFALCVVMAQHLSSRAADEVKDAKESLQGVWIAQSMENDGRAAPASIVKQMRFTFKGDKLFIKGNFEDGREEECTYKIDPKESPKQLDFTPPKEKKAVLGIYEVKGDQLKVCLRHGSSSGGRPTAFATKARSKLSLMVFKKQKP
jgi:uncharacterized protein (TIGR03067 family)